MKKLLLTICCILAVATLGGCKSNEDIAKDTAMRRIEETSAELQKLGGGASTQIDTMFTINAAIPTYLDQKYAGDLENIVENVTSLPQFIEWYERDLERAKNASPNEKRAFEKRGIWPPKDPRERVLKLQSEFAAKINATEESKKGKGDVILVCCKCHILTQTGDKEYGYLIIAIDAEKPTEIIGGLNVDYRTSKRTVAAINIRNNSILNFSMKGSSRDSLANLTDNPVEKFILSCHE